MAVSDGALFIIIGQIAVFGILYRNKIRLWRLLGCLGMIIIGLSAIAVEDTIPAFVFAVASILVAIVRFFDDVSSMVK